MATKWPEAIPLKSVMAKAVANGMLEIFARTGIPLQLLTDQGSQFVGSFMKQFVRTLTMTRFRPPHIGQRLME